jgi:hypothetical protein
MIRDAIEQRVFRNDLPVELISKSLAALVEATIDLTVSNPLKRINTAGRLSNVLGRHNQVMSLCII